FGRVAAADDADLLPLQILEGLDVGLYPKLKRRMVGADEDRLEMGAFEIGADRHRWRTRELQIARDQRRRRDAAAGLHELDIDSFILEEALIEADQQRAVLHRRHDIADLHMFERIGGPRPTDKRSGR